MSSSQGVYTTLKSQVPRTLRRPAAASVEAWGTVTGSLRLLPSFLIVGGQRCGTNSLYEYLAGHPNVARAIPGQEIHFFDWNFDRGMAWYRGHFPTSLRAGIARRLKGTDLKTGESSPYYMVHPLAPGRIARTLPHTKVIVLLRNPIDRAYSHYQHERRKGIERISFDDAIKWESWRVAGELDRMAHHPAYRSFNHQHFSYVTRGVYVDQLERLFRAIDKRRVLVVLSEDLFVQPAAVYGRVLAFLGLPPHLPSTYPTFNPGRYPELSPATRRRLAGMFEEPNHRLAELLGRRLRWE
jgi:sulfotransferase family protein